MTLVPLPADADNSIWMLQPRRDAIGVRPNKADLQLAAILVTRPAPDLAPGASVARRPWKNNFR
jgi:hypothetical protein